MAKAKREGGSVSPLDQGPARDRATSSRCRKVRNALGPNDPVLITGAAPIGAEVIEFFYACGVPVLEGYGMTETCAAATLNTSREVQVGCVGRPLPGTEVSIADDGEILMRGPLVFKGYHRNDGGDRAIIDGDGWLHSGDLGEIVDGYVHITGRKKDLIITSLGQERLAGDARERAARDALDLAGDRGRRPPLVPGRARHASTRTRRPSSPRSSACPPTRSRWRPTRRCASAIWKDIDAVNQRFARIEQIKRFAILPRDLSQEEGELTPTLKVKRSVVYKKFAPRRRRALRGRR